MSVMNKRMIWEPADEQPALQFGRCEVEVLRPTQEQEEGEPTTYLVKVLYMDEEAFAYEDELHPRPEDLPMIPQRAVADAAARMFRVDDPRLMPPPKSCLAIRRCKGCMKSIDYTVLENGPQYLIDPGAQAFGPFVMGYVECMIWSSHTDGNEEDHSEEGGVNYNITDDLDWDDLSVELRKEVVDDCRGFLSLVDEEGLGLELMKYPGKNAQDSLAYAGHDFWLTRNGHGAGFWDGDWGKELGNKLTELAKTYAGKDLMVGDDVLVY